MNRENKKIKAIYVCSPFRAESKDIASRELEIDNNIDRVHQACRLLSALGYMPLAPHGYFTNFLNDNDPDEREDGMELTMEWLKMSDELWIFGRRISKGMSREIAEANELGIPVRCMPEPWELADELMEAFKEESEEQPKRAARRKEVQRKEKNYYEEERFFI